jgi:hypothetical protein
MTYLKYANLCADMVRASLKEPLKTKALGRETVYFRSAVWKDGKPETQGTCLSRKLWQGSCRIISGCLDWDWPEGLDSVWFQGLERGRFPGVGSKE